MITDSGRPQPSLHWLLSESSYRFHLTGSRVFGGYNKESDWDYFCKHTMEVQHFLAENGFKAEHISYETATLVMVRGDIHIQLVSDFGKKLNVQNMILGNPDLHRIMLSEDKAIRKALWSYLLA
jgi:hypothetical protein